MINVSIIIPNWNTKELLKNCINSIFKETKDNTFEIIVIDNASTDGSIEMLKKEFSNTILIENKENLGFTKACNEGIAISKSKYILLLNSDTIILDNAIEKLVAFADMNPDAGIFGPKLLNKDRTIQPSFSHFPQIILSNKMKIYNDNKTLSVDWIRGACLLIRKKIFETTSYLDEYFYVYGEDIDLCYRANQNGWKVVYHPDARVLHLGWKTGEKRWGIACIPKANYEATIKFLKKHKPFIYTLAYRTTRTISCLLQGMFFYILSKFNPNTTFKNKYSIYWIGFLICINKYK